MWSRIQRVSYEAKRRLLCHLALIPVQFKQTLQLVCIASEPGMSQTLLSAKSIIRVVSCHSFHEVSTLSGQALACPLDNRCCVQVLVLKQGLMSISPLKQHLASGHVEKEATQAKHIRFWAEGEAFQEFRCNIPRGPTFHRKVSRIRGSAGEAQVSNAHLEV